MVAFKLLCAAYARARARLPGEVAPALGPERTDASRASAVGDISRVIVDYRHIPETCLLPGPGTATALCLYILYTAGLAFTLPAAAAASLRSRENILSEKW
jgi:hypothetical protein